MILRLFFCFLPMVIALTMLAEAEPSPTPGAADSIHKDTDQPESDSDALVETWVQYAMPGEHHKLLERMAGEWRMQIRYRMSVDSPVVESEGTCSRKWILGKRFLLEEFDGGNLGLPFQGMAIYGYDAFDEKYTSVWVDTMNNAMTTSRGSCEAPCDLISFIGTHGDPWTGKKRSSRGVTRFIDETSHVLELHEPGADGREFKMLEIVYTREKSPGR